MEYLKHTFDFDGVERKLFLVKSTYCADGSLAVLCYEHVEQPDLIMDEEWCDVTVCFPYASVPNPKTDAFVDTNNSPWLEEFLKKNKIANPLGFNMHSGFCKYPAYRFDLKKLHTLKEINK